MSDHMKRLAAPRSWPLKRKVAVWTTKQSAGAHSLETSLPAVTVLKDLIGVCDTTKEAKRIIGNRELFVDGKAVKNPKAPVGLMDVISIPKMNMNYRMLLTDKGKLTLVELSEEEAKWKLCRIEGKTVIKGGKYQLNLSGGRNYIMDKNDYKVGDTLKINVPEQQIVECYPLGEGAMALIIDGSKAGKYEVVSKHIVTKGPDMNVILFNDETETRIKNVFIIGTGKSAIKLPEASE